MNHCFRLLHSRHAFLLVAFSALLITGCGGSSSGGGYGGGDDDDDSGDMEPTLASIQEHVFTPICTECHTGSSAPEGLRLEEGQSHGHLVEIASNQQPELFRVDPGNPDDSYIIRKLEGEPDISGDRMPQNGPPYLDQSDIDVIRQWISEGASDDGGDGDGYPNSATVAGGWPVDGSSLTRPPGSIIVIFDQELDTTLLHEGSVSLSRFDDGDANDPGMRPVSELDIRVSNLAPTTVVITAPDTAWAPGHYEVRVRGTGATPLATRGGQLIDGDGDGRPGGDYVRYFEVQALK